MNEQTKNVCNKLFETGKHNFVISLFSLSVYSTISSLDFVSREPVLFLLLLFSSEFWMLTSVEHQQPKSGTCNNNNNKITCNYFNGIVCACALPPPNADPFQVEVEWRSKKVEANEFYSLEWLSWTTQNNWKLESSVFLRLVNELMLRCGVSAVLGAGYIFGILFYSIVAHI